MAALLRLKIRLFALPDWMRAISLGLLLAMAMPLLMAQQAVPTLSGHVVDNTATLNMQALQQLETKLRLFEKNSGAQIVLLLIPSTQPEDMSSYANRVANSWKIGRKDIGDGVLLLVAKDDHKVRIEVAKSLEGAIPDLAARRIIDESITPRFRQADFVGGLNAAVDQIAKRIQGEALPEPTAASGGIKFGFRWMDLAIFAFFAVPIIAAATRRVFGTNLAAAITGGVVGAIAMFITSSFVIAGLAAMVALLFTLISSVARSFTATSSSAGQQGGWGGGGFGSGSGGGFGSGGGGFSSGGGGDFGGGGASGDW